MALAAESLPQAIAECMESVIEEEQAAMESESESSCLSMESLDSDADPDFGLSLTCLQDEAASELDLVFSHGRRKRRRLAAAKDCCSSGGPSSAIAQWLSALEVNLIILDWDDTLLPSTWLQQQGLQVAPGSAMPSEEQKAELRRIARHVIRTLRRAKRLGTGMIVTNAEKGWIELSCCKFLPEVAPLLEGMKLLSARSLFEHAQPAAQPLSPMHWKRMAFAREVAAFFQRPSRYAEAGCRKSIISVGDSMSERNALYDATDGRECWSKSMKLLERPSPDQLVKQHELLGACLRQFVDYEGSLDLCLQTPN